jgi:hypothetical protein
MFPPAWKAELVIFIFPPPAANADNAIVVAASTPTREIASGLLWHRHLADDALQNIGWKPMPLLHSRLIFGFISRPPIQFRWIDHHV